MRALSAIELLDVWERGQGRPLIQRVLDLLAAACPESAPEALAQLSIGQRDAGLLTLREWTFGEQLVCLADCPRCHLCVQLDCAVSDLRLPDAGPHDALVVSVAGYDVRFRLPNSQDLLAISDRTDVATPQRWLLERCVSQVQRGDQPQPIDQLPPDVLAAIEDQMAQADPQAQMALALTCPECDHHWLAVFDIATYFWSEIDAWAVRLLRDVHVLASTYGWREADIVTMSPFRRQLYLDLINA